MNVEQMFESLKGAPLQQESFPENMNWDDYVNELQKVASNDKQLKKLMHARDKEAHIEQTTLESIMSSPFQQAKDTIDQMTIAKRIAMLKDLQNYREYLYETANQYGVEGIPREEQISASTFRVILGRIKHLEILQNWLYGIL